MAAAMREGATAVPVTAEDVAVGSTESGEASEEPTAFDTVPEVDIDEDARQKYVLIKLVHEGRTKHLVRGKTLMATHAGMLSDLIFV